MLPTTVAAAAGALIGLGLWLAIARPDLPSRQSLGTRMPRLSRARATELAVGVVLAILVLALTRWVVLAVVVFAVVLGWRHMAGAGAEQRRTIARLEAFAVWVESVRDTLATSSGLPEALPAAARHVPDVLQQQMQTFRARVASREPLEQALRALAVDIDDPIADNAIGCLILNVRVQGRALQKVLTSQAESTRKEVELRREIDADRRKIRQETTLIMAITVIVVGVMLVAQDQWRTAFSTPTGQVMFAVAVALFVAGFAVQRHLATFIAPDRFLQQHSEEGSPS